MEIHGNQALRVSRSAIQQVQQTTDAVKVTPVAQWQSVPLSSLDTNELGSRAVNGLESRGIHTLGDLSKATKQKLFGLRNFGAFSVRQCIEVLKSRGLPCNLQ
jgi:DNA-directed RNA polymerase alpha subunit